MTQGEDSVQHHQIISASTGGGMWHFANCASGLKREVKRWREGRRVWLVGTTTVQWLRDPITERQDLRSTEALAVQGSSFLRNFSHFTMGSETVLASRSQMKPMYVKVVAKGVHFLGDQGQPSLAAISQMQDVWNEKVQPDSAEPPVGKRQKEK